MQNWPQLKGAKRGIGPAAMLLVGRQAMGPIGKQLMGPMGKQTLTMLASTSWAVLLSMTLTGGILLYPHVPVTPMFSFA